MPVHAETSAADRGPWWEPAAWFLLCLGLYTALAHEAFYKTDGPDIVRLLDDHRRALPGSLWPHPWHVGYLPALDAFGKMLAAVGLSPDYVRLGDWFSALGAALGVGFARAGMRLLQLPAATARLATLGFAASPGVLLFASVVEFHGPLLAPVGLAFWWTCVQIQRPTWWGMVVLGVTTHGAFLMDGQALFLPAWLLPFFLARRWPLGERGRDVARAAVAGGVHALLFVVMPKLLPSHYGFWADLDAGLEAEGSIGRPQSFDWLPTIFVQEWLWPLLPVSALVFVAPLRRALRLEFAAFAIGLAPFLVLCVRLLVFEPEYGAYVLPLVLPAALLVAQATPVRWQLAVAGSLLVGVLPWVTPDRMLDKNAMVDAAFARSVAEAAGSAEPFVMVGSAHELASAYARLRPEQFVWVRTNAAAPRAFATPEVLAGLEAQLRALHGARRAVLLTDTALDSLDDPRAAMLAEKPSLVRPPSDTMAGPLVAAHLRARFELVRAAPGMLRLVPKP